ncbi:abc transporter [Moniliophthora roreri MCA 2997]|uniref:Abc transporter n=1 Tax=Moniliophthora roreri (strain MCA 2997) TaxID=1381753 RepID=V2X6I0_MONRO|nr:abc transporter [Moniliophthora roreri MCA 2997]
MKIWNPFHPPPAQPGFAAGKVIPERKAFFLSQIFLSWLDPLLKVGFSRPLQHDDLWSLPPDRLTDALTDKLEKEFNARSSSLASKPSEDVEKAERRDENGPNSAESSAAPSDSEGDSTLLKSLHSIFFVRWWTVGILHLFAESLRITTPLVTKVILTWLAESYIFYRTTEEQRNAFGISNQPPPGIGYGIGLAFALFAMLEVASLATNHYLQMSMSIGLSVRASIIGSIFRKSLRLSGKARAKHTTGQVMTMISSDATRLDQFVMYAHNVWIAPVQLIVGIALLIANLGYSALVGLGVLIFGLPIQGIFAFIIYQQRNKGVKITDTRIRLTTEVLQGIRLLKYYAWEDFYTDQIAALRKGELETNKNSTIAQSALIACVQFLPLLASVLSFITYSLSGHDLSVATIFTSLQFFNIIRIPLIMLPFVLSGLSEFIVALRRIGLFLKAEERADPPTIDFGSKYAIHIDNGSFSWDTAEGAEKKQEDEGSKKDAANSSSKKGKGQKKEEKENTILPVSTSADNTEPDKSTINSSEKEKAPFQLTNINLTIPRGSFVAIVGRVGSGKSSLLQAMLGEIKKIHGRCVFGGTLAYVPQMSWIRNATMKENIAGEDVNEQRFQDVLRACSLERDVQLLPHGVNTEIGEKGINLSGGQKARVCLARAAYSSADIVLLDDPLSAVDSYVGRAILENCFLSGPLSDRTRILVTHALHVLDKADYIYVMEDGTIKEEGTYQDLIQNGPSFSRLINEYGQRNIETRTGRNEQRKVDSEKDDGSNQVRDALMQAEERSTGAVTWSTYSRYLRHAGSVAWAPVVLGLLAVAQAAEVGNNLFLGFWTSRSIEGFRQGDYIALYASLGAAQAIFTFIVSYCVAIIGINASFSMFRAALSRVLKSPVAFFDTTPMGRVLSRLSKDQDTLDTLLPFNMLQFLFIVFSVFGTVALVFYTLPLLGIIFGPVLIIYYGFSVYYRRTSVEVKRLDSLSRSAFYSSYSETLTGLTTVRAYGDEGRAVRDAECKLDAEMRAYYLTVTLQRWLAMRLDLFASILIWGIVVAAARERTSVDPSKIGVVITYALSITGTFSEMVNAFAQNEQNMNAAERLLVYTSLTPEKDDGNAKNLSTNWPSEGGVVFKDVEFAYRDGLPLVLKGITFHVKSGEKIGIVGRTGAGKSSIIQALFRIAGLKGGSIEIDGVNISDVPLDILRQRIALVPQDSTLFLGTLRENLDPLKTRTDAELISAMQRAWLISDDESKESKFNLDSAVGDDGSNFSAGEKQLVALCRALVKQSRIIVLDEATSNVDAETDAKLQRTIQTEFAASTILCIAHRLNTIAHYDRVLVMNDGKVAEYGSVMELFDTPHSMFRTLCDEADLKREDIARIREAHGRSAIS